MSYFSLSCWTYLLEVLSDEDLDGLFVPVFGNLLGHEVRLEAAVQVALRELDDVLCVDLLEIGLEPEQF